MDAMDDERSAPSEAAERPETARRAIASLREIVPARHAASDFAADQLAETARDAGELVAVLRVMRLHSRRSSETDCAAGSGG